MESLILVILVIMPGVWTGDWRVTPQDQCALRGSSVVIKCEYDYPFGHIVTSVSWSKSLYVSGEWKKFVLSQLPSPPHHQYVGNYWSDCSLLIHDVQLTDEGQYFFHFTTTLNRWKSKVAARLTVRELTAVVQPSVVTEGDNVSLTCASGCDSPINIVWFKDGRHVPQPAGFQASREDSGRYYCTVLEQEGVRAASVVLDVQYAPSRVTLSVSPTVVRGSSVMFSCSSDANPPVTLSGYSLYKDGRFISSGQNVSISDIQPDHSGLYHCQAWNNISWRGVDRINSTQVHLDVQYRPENVSVSVDPPHVVEDGGVNLICSSAANPAADSYTWYKVSPGSMNQVGSGPVLSLLSVEASHTGLYVCRASNQLGENNSTEVLLNVKEKNHVSKCLLVLAGVGGSVFVTLLLLFWLKRRNQAKNKVPISFEDEVLYSTVIIKPPHLVHNSWSKSRENDSAIYASLAKTG